MEHHQSATIAADSTVRSQDSSNSSDSKETKLSKVSASTRASRDSKPASSCGLGSKHSKEALIEPRRGPPSRCRSAASQRHHQQQHQQHQQQQHQQQQQQHRQRRQRQRSQERGDVAETKDDSSVLMFTSCGQLLLGVVLVVFGVLVLVHGASLAGSGAGLWAGAGALVAGALGVVATLATTSSGRRSAGFSSAHLASSLVALALSNMAAITALTAVVRDSQRTAPDVSLLSLPNDEKLEVDEGWAGLLASIGLLVASAAELFVSGYTCVTLAPKLCGCLRPGDGDDGDDEGNGPEATAVCDGSGKTLKTRNMVHQWVIAQNHAPKNHQPIYVVQPVVPVHPIVHQSPYGMHAAPPPPPPGKYAGGFLTTAAAAAAAYGALPILPAHHVAYPASIRPPSQIVRGKQQQQHHHHLHHQQKRRRHLSEQQSDSESRHRRASSGVAAGAGHQQDQQQQQQQPRNKPPAVTSSIGDDRQLQQDLARTYTGLDKRISEEFISIAMDPPGPEVRGVEPPRERARRRQLGADDAGASE